MILPISICVAISNVEADHAKVWVQIRQEDGHLDGKWEFPGGKIETGESPPVAARRELNEEVGPLIPVESFIPFKNYSFHYKDRSVCLFVHLLYLSSKGENFKNFAESGWQEVGYQEPLSKWATNIPEANENILKDLAKYLDEERARPHWSETWQQLSC